MGLLWLTCAAETIATSPPPLWSPADVIAAPRGHEIEEIHARAARGRNGAPGARAGAGGGGASRSVEQRRPDLRFPLPERFAERLHGRASVTSGGARNTCWPDLDSGEVLAMHLGMTGRFSVPPLLPVLHGERVGVRGSTSLTSRRAAYPPLILTLSPRKRGEGMIGDYTYDTGDDAKHDHVVFTMSSGAVSPTTIARRFGYMTLIPDAELDAHAAFSRAGRRAAWQ